MLTREALDRRSETVDHVCEIVRLPAHRAEGGDLRDNGDIAARDAERVLQRLARHRTGGDEIDAAFRPDELRRVRTLLIAAGTANGRLVRPRRERAAT